MSEPNQVLWRGIRPVDPPEYIPILPYKPGATQYFITKYASGNTNNILTVPSSYVFHIINIFASIHPQVDGFGNIEVLDSASNRKVLLGEFMSDTYRIVNNPIILASPLDLLENESISVYSDTTNFYLSCSLIYTKE